MTRSYIRYVCLLATGTALTLPAEQLPLRRALDQLSRIHPDLAIARLKVLESETQIAITKSAYQPQVNLVIQGAYQTNNLQGIGLIFPGIPSRIGPYRTFNARPQARQTIVDLSLLSQIRAARAQKPVAELEGRAVQDDLALAVIQLYLQALQADSRIAASAERLATAESILAQVRDKEQAGTASKLDIARAEEQLETERGLRIAARRDAQVLRVLLSRAIGMEANAASELELEKPAFALPIAAEANRAAFQSRPDLLALEAKAKVATLDRQAAHRQRLPKLSGFGDFGVLGAGPDQNVSTYTVGATLTIPIWTGRRIEAQVQAASIREDQVKQEILRAKLNIRQEIEQATVELQSALLAVQSSARAAKAAKEILELASLRFQSGLATSVDTQVAQSGLASAEDQRIRNEYEVLLAEARLAKAGGSILELLR